MARRTDPLLQQAQLESQVRYGSQRAGLAELMVQALQDLQRGVAVQQSAAEGVKQAVRAAQPVVTHVYQQGDQSVRQAEQDMKHDLATLSAAADPYRAISDREAQSAKARLSIGLAGALKDLSSREVQAEEGRQYGVQKALSSYQDTSSKVAGQAQALRAEEGAFTQATYGKLTAEQRKREEDAAQKELDRQQRADLENIRQAGSDRRAQLPYDQATAGQILSHQDRQAALTDRQRKANQPTRAQKLAARKQSTHVQSLVNNAWTIAKRLRHANVSPGEVMTVLTSGSSKRGIPRFDASVAQGAVDLVWTGRLGVQSAGQLSSQGLRVPNEWKPSGRNVGLDSLVAGVRRSGSIL